MRLLTVAETAERIGLSPRYTRELLKRGEIPGLVRFRKGYRVREDVLEKWLQEAIEEVFPQEEGKR